MRLLTYAKEPVFRLYEAEVEKLDCSIDLVTELYQVFDSPYLDQHYNGLLVDVQTLIGATLGERELLQNLESVYPAMLIKRGPDDLIQTLGGQQCGEGLEGFVRLCREFSPRPIRSRDRAHLHLNVLLSRTADMQDAEKTVTMNASDGGCFLLAQGEIRCGEQLWLHVSELGDEGLIEAEVCWHSVWGKGNQVPGVGLRFKALSPAQKIRLKHLILGAWLQK